MQRPEEPGPDLHDRPAARPVGRNEAREPRAMAPNRARQGRLGIPVLLVLLGGLLLAMLVWWLVEIYGEAIAPANPVGDPASVPAEQRDTRGSG